MRQLGKQACGPEEHRSRIMKLQEASRLLSEYQWLVYAFTDLKRYSIVALGDEERPAWEFLRTSQTVTFLSTIVAYRRTLRNCDQVPSPSDNRPVIRDYTKIRNRKQCTIVVYYYFEVDIQHV